MKKQSIHTTHWLSVWAGSTAGPREARHLRRTPFCKKTHLYLGWRAFAPCYVQDLHSGIHQSRHQGWLIPGPNRMKSLMVHLHTAWPPGPPGHWWIRDWTRFCDSSWSVTSSWDWTFCWIEWIQILFFETYAITQVAEWYSFPMRSKFQSTVSSLSPQRKPTPSYITHQALRASPLLLLSQHTNLFIELQAREETNCFLFAQISRAICVR